MPRSSNLFDQLIEVSQDYLGPAAERFISRQISAHLSKDPDTIDCDDIECLIDWIKLSFALLTKDTELINEYVHRLKLLAGGKSKEALGEQWMQSN